MNTPNFVVSGRMRQRVGISPPSLLDINRASRTVAHTEEMHLERELRQVRGSNYSSGGAMEQLFRVR